MKLPKTLCAATVAFLIYRLFFAVDFSDESAYAAIPLQFAQGAIPFVDEISALQLGGVLLVPFFKLFLLLVPSLSGVMLFARLLFLLVWAGTAIGLVFFLRKSPKFPQGFSENALWLATLGWIPAIPINLMGLGYNSLGALFLLCGLWAGWRARFEPARFGWTLTLFLSFASWVYPGYAVVLVPYCAIWWLTLPAARVPALKSLLLGVVPLSLLILGLISLCGVSAFWEAVKGFSSQSAAFNGVNKSWNFAKAVLPIAGIRSVIPSALVMTGFSYLFQRRYPHYFSRYGAALVAMVFALLMATRPYFGGIYYAYDLSVRAALQLPLIAFACRLENRKGLMAWMWLPCWLLGFVSALSSSSGIRNLGLGLLPCLFFALLWLGEWLETVTASSPGVRFKGISKAAFAVICAVTLANGALLGVFFYDDHYSQLTHRISRGPFRWLFTTTEKGKLLEEVASDLSKHVPQGSWVTFYLLSGGLLHGPYRNAAASAWIIPWPNLLNQHALKVASRPRANHYFFLTKKVYYTEAMTLKIDANTPDPLLEFVKREFTPVVDKENFAIFKRNEQP